MLVKAQSDKRALVETSSTMTSVKMSFSRNAAAAWSSEHYHLKLGRKNSPWRAQVRQLSTTQTDQMTMANLDVRKDEIIIVQRHKKGVSTRKK